MSTEGLAACASQFKLRLETAGDKAPALWHATIAPILEQYWPKTRRVVTSETNGSLAHMLLATREAFPAALQFLDQRHNLFARTDASRVINHLAGLVAKQAATSDTPEEDTKPHASYDLVQSHPNDVLRLLSTIVNPEGPRWQLYRLDKLLSRIGAICPASIQGNDFKYLSNLIARG